MRHLRLALRWVLVLGLTIALAYVWAHLRFEVVQVRHR